MLSVAATYDGQRFVPEETVNFVAGQKVIITILNEHSPIPSKETIDINKYAGRAGKLFSSHGSVDDYVKGLREKLSTIPD